MTKQWIIIVLNYEFINWTNEQLNWLPHCHVDATCTFVPSQKGKFCVCNDGFQGSFVICQETRFCRQRARTHMFWSCCVFFYHSILFSGNGIQCVNKATGTVAVAPETTVDITASFSRCFIWCPFNWLMLRLNRGCVLFQFDQSVEIFDIFSTETLWLTIMDSSLNRMRWGQAYCKNWSDKEQEKKENVLLTLHIGPI